MLSEKLIMMRYPNNLKYNILVLLSILMFCSPFLVYGVEICTLRIPLLSTQKEVDLKGKEYSYASLIHGEVSIQRSKITSEFRDDEVIVKVEYIGICRADVKEVYAGRDIPKDRGPLFGHELVGEVVFAGKKTGFSIGEKVSFNPNITPDRTTGFAEYFMIKGTKEVLTKALNTVPNGLSTEMAVFSEPFSCVIRSTEKLLNHMGIEDLSGKKVAVIGAGNAGMYHVWLTQRLGAEVTLLNIDDGRLKFVKERGLFDGTTIIFDKNENVQEDFIDHEAQYDVVIVVPTIITQKTLYIASQLVTDGGYIHIYAGTRKGDVFGGVDIDSIRRNEWKAELNIENKHIFTTGAYGTTPDDFKKAFSLLQEIDIAEKMRSMVSRVIFLEELPKLIMEMAEETEDPTGKVIVLPFNAIPNIDTYRSSVEQSL